VEVEGETDDEGSKARDIASAEVISWISEFGNPVKEGWKRGLA